MINNMIVKCVHKIFGYDANDLISEIKNKTNYNSDIIKQLRTSIMME